MPKNLSPLRKEEILKKYFYTDAPTETERLLWRSFFWRKHLGMDFFIGVMDKRILSRLTKGLKTAAYSK